jgi:drug/metabolite transporter (DMT)-like permease
MKQSKGSVITGIILMVIATIFFTLGQVFVKYAIQGIDFFHMIFWRALINLLVVLFIGLININRFVTQFKTLNVESTRWLILNGIFGAIAMISTFLAVTLGELGEVGAITNTKPIFVVILAYIILKEELNYKIWIALIIALAGVFMIKNPFSSSFDCIPFIVMIIATLSMSLQAVSIRKLRLLKIDTWIIVGSFVFLGTVVLLPKVLWEGVSEYTTTGIVYSIMTGIMLSIAHILMTSSAKYIPAKMISILGLLGVFEMMFFGTLLFDEEPELIKILGGNLIVISSVLTILFAMKKRTKSCSKL